MNTSDSLRGDIRRIKGIGEKRAQALNKLGVFSLFDLISYFPRRYEDRSTVRPVGLLSDGEAATICVICGDEPRLSRIRRGLDLVRFRAYDDSGEITITYFNQPYVRNQIHRGGSYRFYGRVEVHGSRRSMVNPACEPEEASGPLSVTGRIVPVYGLRSGLQQKLVRQSVRQGLDSCLNSLPEVLPDALRREFRLADAAFAYEAIHFPESIQALEQARRRFVFEELFVLSCALGSRQRSTQDGIRIPAADFEAFYAALPFSPTAAQRKAVMEAAEELSSGRQMNRLLQGDVGSGKTLVAAALIWQCSRAGYLSLFMAPTEILAEQHYATLSGFLAPFGIRIALLTGSQRTAEKRAVREALERGELDLVVGTHALLSEGMEYPRLALAVTDEQHRFGVDQRARLARSGTEALPPHVYVMSATPIPRTLALIIYGDLSVSILDELPPGRQPVETFCVNSGYHARLLAFIRKLCGEGRQVFVVCPKVEEEAEPGSDGEPGFQAADGAEQNLLSAVEYAQKLRGELPELRIDCLHGRMKPAEKDTAMQKMLSGETDVLVATTVIEVGVDIPNAALMLVENAERFGLSQLHQLRGRVGRGKHQSYCVLVTDNKSDDVQARMKVLCESADGFRIAEEDLRLRGPGDFFGSRQHGLPEMHLADLGAETETLLRAKEAAERLLTEDPQLQELEHRDLNDRVRILEEKMNGTLN